MIKFGTGGWRAIIGEDFTKENVQVLTQAIADMMKSTKEEEDGFVIGYDRRFLSDKAARWMSEVFAGNGIKVFLIDKEAPTPVIMFAVKMLKVRFGAAITASHNPSDYNGIKIFSKGGRDADERLTDSIEGYINYVKDESVKIMDFSSGIESGIIERIYPFNEYIDAIISMTDMEVIRERSLKILLDPMYGVSKTCLQAILITGRCDLDVINDRHDTLFGGRLPSPNSETLQRLKNMVIEQGYDLGIATDGDADRLGVIDESGEFIHPNSILVLLYYYLLKYKGWKGSAVRNIATTHLLDKIAHAFGEECYEVPVGFKHISSMMEEKNSLIGGESSGGLTIRGHIKGKDGIFAASVLVEMISVTGMSLSKKLKEIHETYGYCYMKEADYKFDLKTKERLMYLLYDEKKLPDFGYEIEKVSYRDGVKVYFTNGGWIIARFSGTEPLMRVFTEMDSEVVASEVSEKMKIFLSLK
ncbi:MAG: phosphoglucomutase/phosphomannomutase family protein [Clostridiaceae bacterium]|nr:phosphoglucomutase/phosphomannomutase family protein [Clostridiaceae bacterium]